MLENIGPLGRFLQSWQQMSWTDVLSLVFGVIGGLILLRILYEARGALGPGGADQ